MASSLAVYNEQLSIWGTVPKYGAICQVPEVHSTLVGTETILNVK